jgi:hypothetical protein
MRYCPSWTPPWQTGDSGLVTRRSLLDRTAYRGRPFSWARQGIARYFLLSWFPALDDEVFCFFVKTHVPACVIDEAEN